jgi:transcriptional regulator with XRE-family HTH domain
MAREAKEVPLRLAPLASGLGERVDRAARLVGTRPQAAAVMGISDDQLNRIIREKSVPTFPAIAGLANASGVTFEWLAFGAEPLSKNPRAVLTDSDWNLSRDQLIAMLPRYDVDRTGAATPPVPFPRAYLERVLGYSADEVAIGEHDGDAMEPTISRKALLLVHRGHRKLTDGYIFVLHLGDELAVKRVQREFDGSLLLINDNKAYEDRRLTQDEADRINVIGRLIWSGDTI